PGTKELIIKAALAGGVLPHRLGLSETVLVFKQHLCFLDEAKSFASMIPVLKQKCHEKKIIVEVESIEEARELAILGVDGIQFDKVSCEALTEYVKMMRKINAHITLIAAGGININNIAQYAETGVDVIATSSLFHGKPLDIGAKMGMCQGRTG
ncbi:MAG: ModD protein, partial [Bacillota bacterium]